MDYNLIIQSITVAFGAIGAGKLIYEILTGKRSRMREEYRFAKEFLRDLRSNKRMHPLLREKGYHAIAGDNQINPDEIEYLISLKEPQKALRDYVLGRPYLKYSPENVNLTINFQSRYKSIWSRRWRKYAYISIYGIFSYLTFTPLVFSKYLFKQPTQALNWFVITVTVFGPFAWLSLKAGLRIYRAEKLVGNQHTQVTVIPVSTSRSTELI